MTRDTERAACPICGKVAGDDDRRVLVNGKERRSYCSQSCLRTGVRVLRMAKRRARLRGAAIALSIALALAGAGYVRHLMRSPRPSRAPVATTPVAAPASTEPTPFGPSWPPTDEEWQEQFARAAWVYPLPGPARRRVVGSGELVVAEPAGSARARCRMSSRCGVDLGGELWGEHVYAAHDGVIDRVQRSSEDTPGGVYVRIAHWGGAVFTQYFHLAAVPQPLHAGMHVAAGDVIGLVGDTGLTDARAHLHFALSVRPSSELTEVYWDPEPLMMTWPLHNPERGSVAGLQTPDAPPEPIAGMPTRRLVGAARPAHATR
jgi:hypothetical protein